MKTTLTTLAGLLIGPFIGFFVTHFLFYVRSLSHPDCMWRLGALGMGVTVGAPIGLITFGVIGFWAGRLLDKKAKQRLLHQENSASRSSDSDVLNDDAAERGETNGQRDS